MMLLKNKTVLLGVSGSIAAYKSANLASMLIKAGARVHVIMTRNACNFIHPTTFESLTGNKCIVDTFDRNFSFEIEHISLAQKADAVIIAPASANIIGKIANGIADDMLSTTVMACRCPLLFSPAMNTAMYENLVVQENMEKMRRWGWRMVEPAVGRLACGTVGKGKMAPETLLFDAVAAQIAYEKIFTGKKILVTAGATQEAVDPVRFLTNHSTGKMGAALAKAAMMKGAEVTLVHGHMETAVPAFVHDVPVVSAQDMFESVTSLSANQDIIIKAAAVADFTPVRTSEEKIKKQDGMTAIPLARTQDILSYLGHHRIPGQFLCGFSMETEDILENSRKKLHTKGVDMIVANSLRAEGAGFGADTNIVTLMTEDKTRQLPCMSKDAVAAAVLDEIYTLMEKKAMEKA